MSSGGIAHALFISVMTRESEEAMDSSESGWQMDIAGSGGAISALSAERNERPSARAISDSSTA
eukprot:1161188-Heterocapsa_arctica.AAC.1